ncbi:MAG: LytTR family DNA-binding domain-containing protein [Gammaproteobacteria bacterium]
MPSVTDINQSPQSSTARKVFLWQMVFFAIMLCVLGVSNIFTALSDNARGGNYLPWWAPTTWEFSSVAVTWCLIFAVVWWSRRFPITRATWQYSLPAHLLVTVPYSLVHVAGMVALRKLVYGFLGEHYDFGPWWSNWIYEYRKDFVSYCVIVAGIAAFRVYALWLESHQEPTMTSPPASGPDRLVVRKLNREFILNIADIDRIEADGNYVKLHVNGDSYPLRESLARLEARLDRKHFARVHRGHIVNLDRIREIQPWDSGDYRIVLKDGSFINFSRRYRRQLEHLFKPS